jgi:hypothetical protein
MSTATLERVALPEGFTVNESKGNSRKYLGIVSRGKTEWHVYFIFHEGPLGERIIRDGDAFHRPAVAIYKDGPDWRQRQTWHDDAPLYVQKFIEQHIMQVAEFEQQRHGVRPMTEAEWREEEAREAAKQRAIEAAAERRRAAEIQGVARAIRNVAQCGTVNSEAIAAWVLEMFIERAVVEDERAEHRELLQEIAAERKEGHAEIIGELNDAIDIAKSAQEALSAMDACIDTLDGPRSLEFAYGDTEADKIKDVLSDGISAIREHIWNPKHGDLPEKRVVK